MTIVHGANLLVLVRMGMMQRLSRSRYDSAVGVGNVVLATFGRTIDAGKAYLATAMAVVAHAGVYEGSKVGKI